MEEGAASGIWRDALLVVMRQRRVIVTVYATIVATAAVSAFVIPPRYKASAKVLVTSNRAQISTTPERPTELIRASQVPDTEVNSQLEILRSRDLLETVVRDLKGQEKPAEAPNRVVRGLRALAAAPVTLMRAAYHRLHRLDQEPSTPFYWQVEAIRDELVVSTVRNANVIDIAFFSTDAEWAREVVERLTAAYVDRQAKMQRESEAESFFTQQSEILRQKLADSEAALRARREEIGTLAGQQTEIHARMTEFEGELARTRIARVEQEQRVNYLAGVQGSNRTEGRVASPELLALEAKRAELLGRYRPDSERVREIDDQIRRLRAAISSYGTVTPGVGGAAGAGTTDLLSARAALEALKGKETALARQCDEYRKQAEFLDPQTLDLTRLERQVKLDEETYLSYVRTAEQSRLSNALEQSKMLRLTVVEPAVTPLEPATPNRMRILLFALVGGLGASVGVAFARDHLDGTVKTAADVRRHSGLEVLAVLPDRG